MERKEKVEKQSIDDRIQIRSVHERSFILLAFRKKIIDLPSRQPHDPSSGEAIVFFCSLQQLSHLSLRPLKAYVAQRYSRALNHPVCVASGTAEKQGHSQGSVRLDKKNGL